MLKRKIPNSEMEVSALCLGTAEAGTVMPESDTFRMLDAFMEHGGNFLDTAHEYGDLVSTEKSMSEKTIGRWLKSRNNRNQVIIATKGGMPFPHSRHIPRLSREEIISDLDSSLKALQVNEIDIYYLHRDDENRPAEEIIDVLEEQVKAGKIRNYGLANWKLPRFEQAVRFGEQGPCASQILWSFAEVELEAIGDSTIVAMNEDTWKFHRERGIAVIPYTAQARGFFSKMKDGDITKLQDWVKNMYYLPENLARVERVKRASEALGHSVEALVLAYLTMQPFVTIPVFSSRDMTQLSKSLEAGDITLPEKWVEYLKTGKNQEELF